MVHTSGDAHLDALGFVNIWMNEARQVSNTWVYCDPSGIQPNLYVLLTEEHSRVEFSGAKFGVRPYFIMEFGTMGYNANCDALETPSSLGTVFLGSRCEHPKARRATRAGGTRAKVQRRGAMRIGIRNTVPKLDGV
jgi:hypothetical protein